MLQLCSKVECFLQAGGLQYWTRQGGVLLVHGGEADECVLDGEFCVGVDVGLDSLHFWHEVREYLGEDVEAVFGLEVVEVVEELAAVVVIGGEASEDGFHVARHAVGRSFFSSTCFSSFHDARVLRDKIAMQR